MLKWTVTAKQRTDDKRATSKKLLNNRRSLSVLNDGGNVRTPKNIKNLKSRRSLGSCSQQTASNICKLNNNKENCNLISSTPYRVTNLGNNQGSLPQNSGGSQLNLALRDVSNLTPISTPVTPNSHLHARKRLHCDIVSPTPKRPPQYASTLPSYDVEYSPCEIQTAPYFAIRGLSVADSYYENPRYFNQEEPQPILPPPSKKIKSIVKEGITPLSSRLSELRFSKISLKRKSIAINNNNQEPSLSSSVLGDTALEKMIDAILESAKKEKKTITPKINKFRIFNNNDTLSNKNETPTYKSADDPASDLIKYSNDIILSPSKVIEAQNRTIIINDDKLEFNEREIKTPDSDVSFCLKRRKAVRRKIHKINDRIGLTIPNGLPNLDNSDVRDKGMIGLTLPNGIPSPETPAHYNLIHKSYEQLAEMETPKDLAIIVESAINTNENRENNNNSNSSGTEINTIDLQGSSTPTGVITSSRRCLTFSPDCSSQESSIDKRRSVASSTASRMSKNCLVSGSLDIAIFLDDNAINVHVIRCRDLCRPNGNSINAYVKVAILPSENEIGFQRTAVHRNSSRPYFDHRFKFDLKESLDCNTNKRIQLAVWHRDRECKRSEFLGCMSFPVKNVIQKEINGSFKLQAQSCLTNPVQPIPVALLNHQHLSTNNSAILQPPIMCENSQSSVEEAISIDDGTADRDRVGDENNTEQMNNNNNNNTTSTTTGQTTIAFSKKAIHQRDADENLFLRFLELDPPIEIVPASNSSSGNRRQSSIRQNAGRTPFTITKKLVRINDKGFGFSIVWTHPPRIEKVEPGLSADKSGVIPGDYVIFVDKHNVVTMPEMDILNLIRSQGNILILEIFRRPSTSSNYSSSSNNNRPTNGIKLQSRNIINSNPKIDIDENIKNLPVIIPVTPSLSLKTAAIRTSTVCSSVETTSKRKLNLPQVTFSKESILLPTIDDQRRKIIYQLVHREQNLVTALQFGMERFVIPMRDRKDIISPNDHRTLFQNIDELLRISEDILEQLVQDETEPPLNFISRVYLSKTTALCAAYKKYCNGLKRADCVLVNKSRNSNSDFMNFILEPPVPRKRPDLTTFIHRPLQHFREILKLIQITASHCRVECEEYKNFNSVINDLQAAYREITVGGGLMEPLGEGRPLLTLQDLESRLVFTRCKPFVLAASGRQWIFGGDLSRVEGRSIKPYWTLLFSDILLFAKVSRDRVLFITEEPLPLANITDSCFNIRKKATEFRITIDPNGRQAESPTAHCAPDITRTPRRNARRRSIILRAPSPELKAVWQNLLQRQIFLVNAALGSTPLSSPLESPDVMHTFVPLSDIGAATTSMASIKLSSMDSLPMKVNSNNNHHNHQQTSSKDSSEASKQLEELIDEKCRLLNKSGTSKGGALHLAQWMKGQLDKESERNPITECTNDQRNELEDEERVIDWSPEKLKKRSRELQLVDANGVCQSLKHDIGKRCDSRMEELLLSEIDEESKSPSRSTTSDSQITVRSSPIANSSNLDNSKRCLKCHKNCAKSSTITTKSSSISSASHNSVTNSSLKVQHSQSSPNRCCTSTKLSNSSQASININMNSNDSINNSDSSNKIQHKINGFTIDDEIKTQTIVTATVRNCHLTNGNCTEKEKEKIKILESHRKKCHIPCKCKCEPSEFNQTKLSPDEVIHEKCKIYDNESKLNKTTNHIECRCVCTFTSNIATTKIEKTDDVIINNNNSDKNINGNYNNNSHNKNNNNNNNLNSNNNNNINNNNDVDDDTDWSMMLIGLAQINPTSTLVHVDPFEAVPTISVVPPTPESLTSRFNNLFGGSKSRSEDDDISPEDSPQDEEPPYRVLNTSLKRYGTMSSLEKVPSEDTDDKTYNSSDDDEENDNEELDHDDENFIQDEIVDNGDSGGGDDDDDDIKIITKEVYNANNSQSLRNWTARAGSYVAEKMSFLEESKAFFDKYLGRAPQSNELNDEEVLDECTSGATSGEDVWGTPTSGGENEDMHIFNSDQTHSSPTKSSSSLTGDDDTELMMDELLMAPPMTASTVRGLLPRRRLEPLFEEDTESAEESEEEEEEDDDEEDDDHNNDGGNFNQEQPDDMEKDLRTGEKNLLNLVEKQGKTRVVDELETMKTNMKIDLAHQEYSSDHSTPVITPVERIEMEMTRKTTTPVNEEERIKEIIKSYGSAADTLSTVGETKKVVRDYVASIESVEKIKTKVPPDSSKEVKGEEIRTGSDLQQKSKNVYVVSGLSPRLEMRLALNQDIMDDEDLINYEPGPQNLTKILGHDLSTYHRRTPKDLLMNPPHRTITLNNSHHPSNLSSGQSHLLQQKNSKMDTPTPNRKKSSLSIWSSSASVDLVDESVLTDLERLARREKMFSMSQLRSGRVAPQQPDHKTRKLGGNDKQSSSSLELQIRNNKKNKFFNFLSRRNSSDSHILKFFSKEIGEDDVPTYLGDKSISPRKDVDKSLDRRFWKQLSKRRRSSSVSEISATS